MPILDFGFAKGSDERGLANPKSAFRYPKFPYAFLSQDITSNVLGPEMSDFGV
jgi:hypothetical protein